MKQWNRVPEYWFDSRWHYFSKNHGVAYACLATLAHLAGGMIHRLRVLLQRKDPGDPPKFLRHLIAHDLKALLRGRVPGNRNETRLNRAVLGEGK
jgi:hypothetical protein